jgi:hypothetical protein
MKHICKFCKYSTRDSSHFKRHLKSDKHKQNSPNENGVIDMDNINGLDMENVNENDIDVEEADAVDGDSAAIKKYVCADCGFATIYNPNYYRHKKLCLQKQQEKNTTDKIIKEIEDENNSKIYKVLYEKSMEENKYLRSLVNKAGTLATKSISAISYVMQNYPNAPALEIVDISKYEEMAAPNCSLATTIVHYYRKKKLHKYLGDYVVEFYKKDDPELNSVWASDVVRETFIYRQYVGDKLDWIVDKVAKKTGKKIIDPMLLYIRDVLKIYNAEENKLSKNMKLSTGEMGTHVRNNTDGMDVILLIENHTLKESILKYIAPYFYLDRTITLEPKNDYASDNE